MRTFIAALLAHASADETSLLQGVVDKGKLVVENSQTPNTDWPAAWPPTGDDLPHGPWEKRADDSPTAALQGYIDENLRYHPSMFNKYPLMGSTTIPAGPMRGKRVPFPHTVQDAEGLGFLGTADAAKVREIVPAPWLPVLTVDGRATWATWKDVERVNMLGQVCQRQWVAFYVQHPDHQFPPVEHPFQILYGQFAGFHYYSYTHQMYTDCETVVEIDRNLYGWDSHYATHDYTRDIHGNLDWSVTSREGRVMDMHVSMPYGPETILAQMEALQQYGNGDIAHEPEQFLKFVKQRQQQFHWLGKPGILPIPDSESLTPVIHSPFGEVDTDRYPSTNSGDQWDNRNNYESSYYDTSGPFGVKMPFGEGDYMHWYGEFADFDMQNGPEFSLAFYTHHFQMIWTPPWTFVPVNDEAPPVYTVGLN